MNKEELKNKIADLEKQLVEAKEQINSIEDESVKKGVRQKPQAGDTYFYIDCCGYVDTCWWTNHAVDLFRFNTGNCFKTEQEAEEYKENLLTKQALKDLALELNNGVEIDWHNYKLTKYCIFISCVDELYLHYVNSNQHLGQVYCYNKDFLTIAKERIGEERLIKLIKSGV